MQVILLKDIPHLGRRGEVKNVSDAHAMNVLFPRGLVTKATPQAVAREKERQVHAEEAHAQAESEIVAKIAAFDGQRFEIKAKADKTGHLYQKIDVAKVAILLGIPETAVHLSQPLKALGEQSVEIVFGKTKAMATVAVIPE